MRDFWYTIFHIIEDAIHCKAIFCVPLRNILTNYAFFFHLEFLLYTY